MIKRVFSNTIPENNQKKTTLESRADSLVDSDIEKLRNRGVIQMYPAIIAAAAAGAAAVAGKPEDSADSPNSSIDIEFSGNKPLSELLEVREKHIKEN